MRQFLIGLTLVTASFSVGAAPSRPTADEIDRYVRPYVTTNNFSGTLLVARDGKPLFEKAYGFADFARGVPNAMDTRFHVASMSMQYTAAAALRLIMAGKLSLDTPVSRYVPDFPNGRDIDVRHLLTQTSGIRDINGLPDYPAILETHQTPQSLVEKVRPLAPERAPGTYEREEHSAYNMLALIIERETRLPFADAVKKLVFAPLHMDGSGIDDDRASAKVRAAAGHQPAGVTAIERSAPLHWSAKAGNRSAFTTANDQLRFVTGLFDPKFLDPKLRSIAFNTSQRVGYGWFKSSNARFGQTAYSMNGRAPGFSSAEIYLPNDRLLVVALSNVYASFTPDIANDVAAIALGKPYKALQLKKTADPASLNGLPAQFHFGPDFYQPNATVTLSATGSDVSLRWPTGDQSPMIPVSTDRFVDRAYGVNVEVQRDSAGAPHALKYDRFIGDRVR